MRTLIATNMYPTPLYPHFGIFVKEQAESLQKASVEVEVFFTSGRNHRSAYFRDIGRLRRLIRLGRFDIIHVHHSYSALQCLAALRLARARMPMVFTFHEGEAALDPRVRDPQADFLKQFVYSKRIKKFALGLATAIISVSRGLPEVTGFEGQYEIIPSGADLELFRPMDKSESRRRLALPQEKPIVFFPADPSRLIDKDVDLFHKALAHLPRKPDILYGGAIPHEQMPVFMNAADAVIQTSRFEASPMVVKEAMACNRPVISTDVGDVAEIFGETPGCYLTVRSPSAVAAAIECALRFRGPHEGRTRIVELGLSMDDVTARILSVYEKVLRLGAT